MRTIILSVTTTIIFLGCSPKLEKDIINCVFADSDSINRTNLVKLKASLAESSKKLIHPISRRKYRLISSYIIEAEKLRSIQSLPVLKCAPQQLEIETMDTFRVPFAYHLGNKISESMRQDSISIQYLSKIFEAAINKSISMDDRRLVFDSLIQERQFYSQCRTDSIKVAENKEEKLIEQRAKVDQVRTNILLSFHRAHRKALLNSAN